MKSLYQKREHWYHCQVSKNLSYPAHLHGECELHYVLSGEIDITINGQKHILKEGDLSIAFPNTIHTLSTREESSVLIIIFDGSYISPDSNELYKYIPQFPFLKKQEMHQDFHYCLISLHKLSITDHNYMNDEFATKSKLVKGYLTILLARILSILSLDKNVNDDPNLLHQLLSYLDNNYTNSITLDLLEKELKTSKFYISRIFHTQLNTTLNDYINEKRIRLAEYLLIERSSSITSICFESGFDSTRTFYRVFQSHHGITPSAYRKIHKLII